MMHSLLYIFPAATAVLGVYFYQRSSASYIRFVFSVWFLAALVRRLVDYELGWTDPNPILAAPLTASLACVPVLLRMRHVWRRPGGLAFALAFLCIVYGVVVGVLTLPLTSLAITLLSWSTPLVFGFFLYYDFSSSCFDESIKAVEETFLWGAVGMGAYGIVQFIHIAPWDAMWMAKSGLTVIGTPEAYGVRVFSTMNGPAPLAWCLSVAVLFATKRVSLLTVSAGILGGASLLLSSVRAAWIGLAIGLTIVFLKNGTRRMQTTGAVAVVALCLIAACASVPSLRTVIEDRFATFADVKDDSSMQDRSNGYQQVMTYVEESPFGLGLGAMDITFLGKTDIGPRDSGLLELLLSLGWPGAALYSCCLLGITLLMLFRHQKGTAFCTVSTAVSIGMLFQIALGSVMIGLPGALLWGFAGVSLGLRDKPSNHPPRMAGLRNKSLTPHQG